MQQYSTKRKSGWLWKLSLASFILAGLTGFLYRLGMMGWVPEGLWLGNIRHAHSHLMFFGWAVPFPMYILFSQVWEKVDHQSAGIRWMRNGIIGGLLFGLLAYPFFLFYGYRPVAIGTAELPLSVICSGLVMINWYLFSWGYFKLRHQLESRYRLWWDGALMLLCICSLGAWSIGIAQAAIPDNDLLQEALTHFFLAVFTEGWVVLALIAILVNKLPLKAKGPLYSSNISLSLICLGAPLSFPFGISESLLSPLLLGVARLGGFLTAVGLFIFIAELLLNSRWRRTIWLWPIIFLGLKALMQLVASIAPASFWLSDHALRILYLHTLLLGALTVTLSGWLQKHFSLSKGYFQGVVLSICLTLISLIFMTKLWPGAWSGGWIFYSLVIGALLPVTALSAQWIRIVILQNSRV